MQKRLRVLLRKESKKDLNSLQKQKSWRRL